MTPARLRLLAAVSGAAVGLAGRNTPTALAARLIRSPRAPRCSMEEVLECVLRDSGTALVGVARLAFAAVAISAIAAVVGTVAAAVGFASRRRLASPLLVAGGVMLASPAVWMVGSSIVFLAT